MRGVANSELTAQLAFELGRAGAYVLTQQLSHKPKILVGKDTRLSGDMLECALAAGICSTGAQVELLGVIPTPAVAYLVRKYGADAGVVISASHNSFEYNGIKFFNSQGYKLPDEVEDRIEAVILDGKDTGLICPVGEEVGHCTVDSGALDDYIEFAKGTIDCDLSGLHIAVDCSNGANYLAAPAAMRSLGAEVTVLSDQPNGININAECGSTHLKNLCQCVSEHADIQVGIAFDGDADRMLAVDENGEAVRGDEIMMIAGKYLKEQGRLKKDTIAATVMSNLGLTIAGGENGINIEQTAVGDRYVLESMLKNGYVLGGEESGHIIYLEHNTTGDGLVSALLLLSIMKKTGKSLSELKKVIKILPQVLVNAKVKNENKPELNKNPQLLAAIAALETEFAGKGRVLIRPSGTEPVVRVMLEGNDRGVLEGKARVLADMIEQLLA